jgi:hypothetical protein
MKLAKDMRKFGWLAFKLMWLPFSTLMIAMLGLPEGEYDWVELPILARYSLVIGGILAASAVILLIGAPIVSGIHNLTILKQGLPAQAVILKITDTGTTINKDPLVRLLLEVQPPGEPAFKAETERLIPRLQIPLIQPGTVVEVKYDPHNKTVALLDEDEPDVSGNNI